MSALRGLAEPVTAQTAGAIHLYVAKSGNDANECLSISAPCVTIQGAIGKVPYEKRANVFVSPGTYPERLRIIGDVHHRIEIYGPYDGERCIDPAQVVISAPGESAIWAQDHATAIFGCLTIGPAQVGIFARQFVILDFGNVRFDRVGTAVVLETSVANCGGTIWITSGGLTFAGLSRSHLNVACRANIAPGLSFTSFFQAEKQSTIDTTGAVFTDTINGKKWILSNSEIGPNCDVPGRGVTQTNYAVAPAC